MIIVLDTCVLMQDFLWKGTNFSLLEEFIKITTSKIHLPELVIDEITVKFDEKYLESFNRLNASYNDINTLHSDSLRISIPDNLPACAKNNFISFISNKIKELGIVVESYPYVSHKEVVMRSLSRGKPFSKDGRVGYRDFLIWETVLKIAAKNPKEKVAFISSNTNDFSNKGIDINKLHPTLLSDIDSKALGKDKIEYYSSLKYFIDSEVKTLLAKADEVNEGDLIDELSQINNENTYSFFHQLCAKLEEILLNGKNFDFDTGVFCECINVRVDSIFEFEAEPFRHCGVENIRYINDNTILVSGDVGIYTNLSFDVSKTDVLELDRIRFDVDTSNNKLRSDYIPASADASLSANYQAIYSLKEKVIHSIDMVNLRNTDEDCFICDNEPYDDDDEELIQYTKLVKKKIIKSVKI